MSSYFKKMHSSFIDELEKIAGTGQTRIERTPIHPHNLLEKTLSKRQGLKELKNLTKVSVAGGALAAVGALGGLYGAYKANQFIKNTKNKLQVHANQHYENI